MDHHIELEELKQQELKDKKMAIKIQKQMNLGSNWFCSNPNCFQINADITSFTKKKKKQDDLLLFFPMFFFGFFFFFLSNDSANIL